MCLVVLLSTILVFGIAYKFYGNRIFKLFNLDNANLTPANKLNDGVDFIPASKSVLLGHHFSSIAGAAPIIGPITAAAYGWGPVFLWIVVGAIFIGCVHDFSSLIISVRHQGNSIGNIIEFYLGKTGKVLFLLFCIATLILVVAVFMVVVSKTFLANPATITAALLYIILAIIFGLLHTKLGISAQKLTPLFIPLLGLSIWIGIKYPLIIPPQGFILPLTNLIISPSEFCIIILMGYIFIAAITPVWVLLQPRDYLSSFLLYAMIALAFAGICVSNPEIKMPMFKSYSPQNIGMMFPMLFVVVACGAISGFHAVVASGTTSKQLKKESDAKVVGFGAMLIEGILAVMALIMVLKLDFSQYTEQSSNPILLFSKGFGSLMPNLKISQTFGQTFATLAVSAFALTTLDTATRLSRLSLQDLLSKTNPKTGVHQKFLDRYSATLICTILAGLLALSGEWKMVWPVFGAANQLLAAMALLTVTFWLWHLKKNIWYTLIPTCFMFTVTLSALSIMIYKSYSEIIKILKSLKASDSLPIDQIKILEESLTSEMVLISFSTGILVVALLLLALAIRIFRKTKAGNSLSLRIES